MPYIKSSILISSILLSSCAWANSHTNSEHADEGICKAHVEQFSNEFIDELNKNYKRYAVHSPAEAIKIQKEFRKFAAESAREADQEIAEICPNSESIFQKVKNWFNENFGPRTMEPKKKRSSAWRPLL